MKLRIETITRLRPEGALGAWMLVLGPVLGSACFLAPLNGFYGSQWIVMSLICLFATMFGLVLVLVGRSHDITVTSGELGSDDGA